MGVTARFDIRDVGLAPEGALQVAAAERGLPVLRAIGERWQGDRPLAGVRVACALNVTVATACLLRALKAAGADVALCAASSATTDDAVAATLVADDGIPVFAIRDEDNDAWYAHLDAACDHRPAVVVDDGADLCGLLHSARREQLGNVIAGATGSATGALRLRSLERDGALAFPAVALHEARARQLYDHRYGTGQATLDAVVAATGLLVAGITVAVVGYGWSGRGIAARARGLGAHVVVCEVDPLKAVEATLDGYEVLPLAAALPAAALVVTATGGRHALAAAHVELLRDGAVIANAGNPGSEVDVAALRAAAVASGRRGAGAEELELADGRRVVLLAEGRPVGQALPAAALDIVLAVQALGVEYAVRNASGLDRRVYAVPAAVDREVAWLRLAASGVAIDRLSDDQVRYLDSWGGLS